jgi:hypothetical protein
MHIANHHVTGQLGLTEHAWQLAREDGRVTEKANEKFEIVFGQRYIEPHARRAGVPPAEIADELDRRIVNALACAFGQPDPERPGHVRIPQIVVKTPKREAERWVRCSTLRDGRWVEYLPNTWTVKTVGKIVRETWKKYAEPHRKGFVRTDPETGRREQGFQLFRFGRHVLERITSASQPTHPPSDKRLYL